MDMNRSSNVLITGATSGLGEGMARHFARNGANLALCGRRIDRLRDLQQELTERHGIRVEVRALDVDIHVDVFRVFDDFASSFGTIDRIIVNAGIGQGRRIGTGHFEVNRKTVNTNFVSALAQCEAAVAIFRAQNAGHLVTISSMSSIRGLPRSLTAYAASKAGLANLTEGIRAELLRTPIRVSCICPGYIRTELNASAKKLLFEMDQQRGTEAIFRAILREPAVAYVPGWPWWPLSILLRLIPLAWVVAAN